MRVQPSREEFRKLFPDIEAVARQAGVTILGRVSTGLGGWVEKGIPYHEPDFDLVVHGDAPAVEYFSAALGKIANQHAVLAIRLGHGPDGIADIALPNLPPAALNQVARDLIAVGFPGWHVAWDGSTAHLILAMPHETLAPPDFAAKVDSLREAFAREGLVVESVKSASALVREIREEAYDDIIRSGPRGARPGAPVPGHSGDLHAPPDAGGTGKGGAAVAGGLGPPAGESPARALAGAEQEGGAAVAGGSHPPAGESPATPAAAAVPAHGVTSLVSVGGGLAAALPQQPGESDEAYARRVRLGQVALGLGVLGMIHSIPSALSSHPQLAALERAFRDGPPSPPNPLGRIETYRRGLVRAWTDHLVDLAEWQKAAQKALGRPLDPLEMATELARLNPTRASDVLIQQRLRPALQLVGGGGSIMWYNRSSTSHPRVEE